ncbi:hypothetical protein HPG02_00360 [Pediococcus pentosaceus]|uniref:hypothetical protein n=1 Tax=Pediococcus pentosaceus TaxID=1255 RepID=UPI001C1EED6C|nr:hypothetical protein [Pediococcus pentosaceus]MBU7002090.1 hypothetical protein [Pediococcus pentosaceus]MCG9227418.1 hypothetical protein [Pediococcus pentosaceus]MDA8037445.1 hypothetical protein [Pediococcus pentosaceus]
MKFLDKLKKRKDNNDPQSTVLNSFFSNEPFIITVQWGEFPSDDITLNVDDTLSRRGLPQSAETNPYFSIIQFELLLEEIFNERVAGQVTEGDFVIPEVKIEHNLADHDSIVITNLTISLNNPVFENLTKFVADTIFNNEDYSDAEYQEQTEFIQLFNQAYKTECDVDDDQVAAYPTEMEVEKLQINGQMIETHVPALQQRMGTNETDTANTDATNVQNADNSVSKEPTNYNENDAQDMVSSSKNEPADDKINANQDDQPFNIEKVKNAESDISFDKTQSDIQNGEEIIISKITNDYPISFPKFEVAPLEHKEPGETGYVDYQLNQDKIQFNEEISKLEQTYRDQFKADLAEQQQNATIQLNDELAEFIKQADQREFIHENVVKEVQIERNNQVNNEKADIQTKHDTEIEKENDRHKAALAEIDQKRDASIKQITQEIDQTMAEKVESEERKQLAEQTRDLIQQREDLIKTTQSAQQVDIAKFAANNVSEINKYGTKLIQQAREVLSKNQTIYVNNNSNAKQAIAAEIRAKNAAKKIETDYEEFNRKDRELVAAKAEIEGLKNENGTLKAQVNTARTSAKDDTMQNLITAMALNGNNKSTSKDSTPELFKAFLEAQKSQQAQPINNTNNKQNWIIAALASLLVVSMIAFSGMFITNQNSRYNQLQSQMNQSSQMLKEAKQNNQKLSDNLSSETSKRVAAESEAESAKDRNADLKAQQNSKDKAKNSSQKTYTTSSANN